MADPMDDVGAPCTLVAQQVRAGTLKTGSLSTYRSPKVAIFGLSILVGLFR